MVGEHRTTCKQIYPTFGFIWLPCGSSTQRIRRKNSGSAARWQADFKERAMVLWGDVFTEPLPDPGPGGGRWAIIKKTIGCACRLVRFSWIVHP
jgi:hypothetical protein